MSRLPAEIAALTDPGLNREQNEDCIGYSREYGIAVLADGMGGHQAGEVASKIAVDSVLRGLQKLIAGKNAGSITGSQLLEFVSNTISNSNARIFEAATANTSHKGMGTTLVAAILLESRLYVGHVGDSRVYLFRNQELKRITKDHSLIQDLVDKGFYTEDEARSASVKHVVTRALGAGREVEVDTIEHEVEENDLLLLCSDGLTDMLSDGVIAEVLGDASAGLENKAKNLVDLANRHGGKDNISVILIRQSADRPPTI
ncbi:MAG: Stp1/IreP family PP2C-type Ser/Thr phosphatase [Pseudohongiellaceae bacterium]